MKAATFDDHLRQSLSQLCQHFQPPAEGRNRLLEAAQHEGKSVLDGSPYLPHNTQFGIRNTQSTTRTIEKER